MSYSLVSDSNLREYVKEEDYGYIARIEYFIHGQERLHTIIPMNKGVDMSKEELQAAWVEAQTTQV